MFRDEAYTRKSLDRQRQCEATVSLPLKGKGKQM